jgi:methionyl-tRNA formyltransferase
MRLVFAGTPQAAVPSLMALLNSTHTVAAVLTRPDAPAGRGRKLTASPIAQCAEEAGVEVLRPPKPSDPAFLARLAQIAPDCCPVTAYGALIPAAALAIPPHGWVNLHFSVLPAWRGAAPVPHAILHGDEITGATTFSLVRELDAGPVYGVLTEPIGAADTAGDLLDRLSVSGAELLVATLDGIESGQLEARPQPADGVTLAPKLTKADARVNWKLPALAVDRLIRACTPAPGAWTTFNGASLKVWPVTASARPRPGGTGPVGTGPVGTGPVGTGPVGTGADSAGTDPDGAELGPGDLRVSATAVLVGTGTTAVRLGDVQLEGKRRMPAADWARGIGNSGSLVLD